jgi:hypothetical protein
LILRLVSAKHGDPNNDVAYSVWSGYLDHEKEKWHDKITHEGEVVGRNHPVTGQVVPPV